jgi:hypothetical protein
METKWTLVAWAVGASATIGSGLLIVNGIRQGGSWSDWSYLTGLMAACVLITLSVFAAVMPMQLRAVAALHPGATLTLVFPTAQLAREVLTVAEGQGIMRPKTLPNAPYTLAVDHSAVHLVLGSVKPADRFSFAASTLRYVGVGKVFQGVRMHDCLELGFGTADEPLSVRVCLVRWVTIFPVKLRRDELQMLADQIRTLFEG